jgi:Xaa-Pro dipeptidase
MAMAVQVDYQARMQKLLDASNTDVVAFVPGPNMVYFTGLHYHLSERPIIAFLSKEGLSFIMPQLEMIKLNQRPDLEGRAFMWTDTEGYKNSFRQAMQAMSGASIAVDGMTLRVFEWLALAEAGMEVGRAVDAGQTMLYIRSLKTPDEIAFMKRANEIAEAALEKTLKWVQPGMTEAQIATRLSDEMNAAGSHGNAFGSIVLTGPKSALPHGSVGERQLGKDEFLLIDFGCLYNDYPSDITRTFCLGTPSGEMRKMYEAVYRANAAARAIAKPGVTCGAVDKAARDQIEAAGYGEYFTHRTGHGLGLSGHELPQIASGVDTVLEPGMVFTIEPGVYIPEIGGVRIEDDMVVTETGCDSLTSYPREL